MTHLCAADWDALANDVTRGGCSYTHRGLMLLGLFPLCLYVRVDLLFLRDEIVCIFLCLTVV